MKRSRSLERSIAVVRLIAVPFAIVQVALTDGYPAGYEAVAWGLVAILVVGAVALYVIVRDGASRTIQVIALAFDFAIVSGFTLAFAFVSGNAMRQLLYVAVVMGAARFGMTGGVIVALAAVPVTVWFEQLRSHYFVVTNRFQIIGVQAVAGLLIALIVGWLYSRIDEQRKAAELRADEAEALRDVLGRRVDLLDAANRCARALNSSLVLDEAFGAFIREVRGLVPFRRMAIVLAEEDTARVIATAGADASEVMPPGTVLSLDHNVLDEVVRRGQTIVRGDMVDDPQYAEEAELVGLGLRSRVAAPLLSGARAIGLISLGRAEANAFDEEEIELVSLLGRLAASAVQNIRAYDSERRTVEELRRLSALRADFVSLVSHELRSPMAAVIGAARTLQQRWRELQPEQREAFLALIGDETTRLAALIGDVLDTSRIEAGTFSYRFGDVDIANLVQEAVAMASIGQDEVPLDAQLVAPVPSVRGDGERLRQVLSNLIDNAVKYSPAGTPVEVRVLPHNGIVDISVSDRGPGIEYDDQGLIFEKFGRVSGGTSKPGTGLGLFIARSIAEAHGGSLGVSSAPGRGATFTLRLPVS